MTWRLMSDFPEKTGRYCVGHRGHIFSDAYFAAADANPLGSGYRPQLPQFGPTHWLDDEYEMEGDLENRFELKGKHMKENYSDGWRAGQHFLRKTLICHLKKFKLKRAYRELFR